MRTRLLRISAVGWLLFAGIPTSLTAADYAVILQYHHFGDDTPPSTSVTLEQFDRHLAYLAEHEFTVWPVEKIVSYLQHGKELPENCVGITIDDAYRSVYERAFPRLKERGWPFTVFVTTEGVDRQFKSSMTWDQMRAMLPHGATFANHSHAHDYLIRRRANESEAAWRDRVTRDILYCQERLRAELGSAPGLFAYPFGEYSRELKKIVAGLGMVAFGQHSGAVWSGSDFLALPRFPMAAHFADMDQFVLKVRSLPLPVLSAVPDDPVLPDSVTFPVLRLKLAPGDYSLARIACFVSGEGSVPVRITDQENRVLEVSATKPLPRGRSRYNITAPHKAGGRYYWYSHLWIRN